MRYISRTLYVLFFYRLQVMFLRFQFAPLLLSSFRLSQEIEICFQGTLSTSLLSFMKQQPNPTGIEQQGYTHVTGVCTLFLLHQNTEFHFQNRLPHTNMFTVYEGGLAGYDNVTYFCIFPLEASRMLPIYCFLSVNYL